METELTYIGCSKEQIKWGSCDDPTAILVIGETYVINRTEVCSWHTKIELKEFLNKWFNSVCFE